MSEEKKTNGLIICPDCLEKGKKYILGSVTPIGDLEVLRYPSTQTVTIIRSTEYAVVCMCGFGTVVKSQYYGVAKYTRAQENN